MGCFFDRTSEMVNIIDYSELKKASEVLERQQVTPHPHPNKSSGES